MVKNLIYACLLIPFFLLAGEFTASVNRNEVTLGENIILTLSLKEATPTSNPLTEELKRLFYITSQQQSSNTVISNGRVTSHLSWKLHIHPQKEGKMVIPPIKIQTSEGVFSTKAIEVNVVKDSAANSNNDPAIAITAAISRTEPYKNEPIVYTVKMSSKDPLRNLRLQKLEIADAIVESHQEPIVYDKVIDGTRRYILEYRYLITPLKAEKLIIPSGIIQGDTPVKGKYGRTSSLLDDDFGHLSIFEAFERHKPFVMSTEEITVDVQPAVAGLSPWLPAKSVQIEEKWSDIEHIQAGEPIIRELIISAEGSHSSLLPNLAELFPKNSSMRVYADQPELSDKMTQTSIHSVRKEVHTLIPQQPGTVTLPEITLAWWDVVNKEKAYIRIPEKTIEILPAPAKTVPIETPKEETNAAPLQHNKIFYGIAGVLGALLFALMLWVITLKNRIAKLTEKPEEVKIVKKPVKPKKDKRETLPDLNPT